jgi:hypothetical protein
MVEIFPHRDRATAWRATIDQAHPNWDALFDGFRATVDWPGVAYWRELVDHYPEAKVVLTLRDPERWFDSAQATIFNFEALPKPDPAVDMTPLVYSMFDYRLNDREHCIAVFNQHTREVIETVPSDRLLQLRVSEGWDPLCTFLNCEVPNEAFPHVNESADFVDMVHELHSKGLAN